ncbi:hypothetical protein [Bradyrhizobium sp. WSM2254]|uniref:hypothetical protein n=1 Tax=Bradyrhizobium sp. WSM2254 TaxID=1188263 RepID=UPI000422A845|nr:hypothetical protein [Bradyrhizobium sp. WSM2254]
MTAKQLTCFYAIVADYRTRGQYLFSKPVSSVLMSSQLIRSVSDAEYGRDQETRKTVEH